MHTRTDLALQIAKDYKYLITEKDRDGMTALQLLACTPSAFHRRREDESFFKFRGSLARRNTIRKEEEKYKSALELAELLIQRDNSWELTQSIQDESRPKIHKYGVTSDVSLNEKTSGEVSSGGNDTPLFLATKSGCTELVKLILKIHPQAVEYINDDGQNILHTAIKYRQREIFELVKNVEAPMRRLVRKIDNTGNTILHITAKIDKDYYVPERMEGPALVLQDELLWFERVKDVILPPFMNHRNNMNLTAEACFNATNTELRLSSREWLKHTAEGCSVLAVLIATVAFAAAYTVPGGSNQDTGFPVLINKPFFVVFTITDVFSLTFSLASVVTFLSILSSPFRLEDFRRSLPNKLTMGFTFLFLSVVMMMIAFAATILLMIQKKENWAKIMLYTFSFIPVAVFALTHYPIYVKRSIQVCCDSLFKKTKQLIPRSLLALLKCTTSCFSISSRAPTTSSCIP